MKPFILIAAVIYTIGLLVGFHIEPVLAESADTGSFSVWDIAKNNLASVIINIIGGLSLGVVSVMNTVYNGVILGYALSIILDHYPVRLVARHLLPHSIEIVGITLSCALGLYIAYFVFKTLLMNRQMQFQTRPFVICFALTVIIITVAAALEVHVSMS
ncbi:stage II sporulation protein M [Echinicola salinicaeni]|uniref:stage II sporulation protein M n=1 Tax=Echinicola salinicaeni TaxID=2762757 RepID=UPI0016445DA8|nr:stage II sporulation protein M [Echinicola salinicaeni]